MVHFYFLWPFTEVQCPHLDLGSCMERNNKTGRIHASEPMLRYGHYAEWRPLPRIPGEWGVSGRAGCDMIPVSLFPHTLEGAFWHGQDQCSGCTQNVNKWHSFSLLKGTKIIKIKVLHTYEMFEKKSSILVHNTELSRANIYKEGI